MDEEIRALADRPGWTVEDRAGRAVATYQPGGHGWRATLRALRVPGKSYDRFHVAVVDPAGLARYARAATTVPEARRLAEGAVQAHAEGPA